MKEIMEVFVPQNVLQIINALKIQVVGVIFLEVKALGHVLIIVPQVHINVLQVTLVLIMVKKQVHVYYQIVDLMMVVTPHNVNIVIKVMLMVFVLQVVLQIINVLQVVIVI
jgi:hypothetical protein